MHWTFPQKGCLYLANSPTDTRPWFTLHKSAWLGYNVSGLAGSWSSQERSSHIVYVGNHSMSSMPWVPHNLTQEDKRHWSADCQLKLIDYRWEGDKCLGMTDYRWEGGKCLGMTSWGWCDDIISKLLCIKHQLFTCSLSFEYPTRPKHLDLLYMYYDTLLEKIPNLIQSRSNEPLNLQHIGIHCTRLFPPKAVWLRETYSKLVVLETHLSPCPN